MALDHALRGEERLDLFSQLSDTVVLLEDHEGKKIFIGRRKRTATYPHPIWPLRTETEALKAETDTGLASALAVWLLVAFLVVAR